MKELMLMKFSKAWIMILLRTMIPQTLLILRYGIGKSPIQNKKGERSII